MRLSALRSAAFRSSSSLSEIECSTSLPLDALQSSCAPSSETTAPWSPSHSAHSAASSKASCDATTATGRVGRYPRHTTRSAEKRSRPMKVSIT
eukprot:scaffold16068_cov113-Isochrysis_galbana.AAC.7